MEELSALAMEEMLSKLPEDALDKLQEYLWDVERYFGGVRDYTQALFYCLFLVAPFVAARAGSIKRLEEQVAKLERELEDWR